MDIRPLCRPSLAKSRRIWIAGILGVSCVSTLVGISALFAFNQTAGAVSPTPLQWPEASTVRPSRNADTLLVFVHPYCSCSTATVAELAGVAAARSGLSTTVLFYRPQGSDWRPASLWKKVKSELTGANLIWDDGGREARRFGALTSGYTVLYGEDGKLLFRGGVTGSRGHEGGNFGIERLRAAIETGIPSPGSGLVFGCALAGAPQSGGKL